MRSVIYYNNSHLIDETSYIIKITGRYFIPQLEDGLRILVLIGTIIYTVLKIRNEVKNK